MAIVNAIGEYGTPLLYAAQKWHLEIVNMLLANGAKSAVNVRDNFFFGPELHESAYKYNVVAVDAVRVVGAIVNINDSYNQTPLHKAAKGRN
jgi:ankyrin repeat protein